MGRPRQLAAPVDAAARQQLRRARLRFASDRQPGIRRQRAGRGFIYLDPDGKRISDPAQLQRIRRLAIPPAYREVWICCDPDGHLQATGRDARGRKQYRYHPHWRLRCEASKFDRVLAFGRALPRLRRRLRADLARPGLPRDKVLALAVSVLTATLLRVGNREYARHNGSYGLTTLCNRHVRFTGSRACLRFRGKHGQLCEAAIDDPRLVRLIRRCQQLPGQELFQYVDDDDGSLHPVDSGMLNAYLHDAMGEAFSAKDFRTWGGTKAAVIAASETPRPSGSERRLTRARNQVIGRAAELLGNSPAVCRRAYIHPDVLAAWDDGRLQALTAARRPPRGAADWERLTVHLLSATANPAGRRPDGRR
jgi:DNA topoisomerase I